MIPADGIKIVGDNIEIKFINVLSPIQIKTLPPNYLDFFDINVDGKPIPKETLKKMVFSANGKDILMSNASSANNLLIPVGMIISIKVPNIGLKKGEEHKFDVKIANYTKYSFSVERTIQ
jgi:hypothetical protein